VTEDRMVYKTSFSVGMRRYAGNDGVFWGGGGYGVESL